MKKIHKRIICCYLYPITKYGYPPDALETKSYMREMSELGFCSIELEGIREKHLTDVAGMSSDICKIADELNLNIPYFCAVLPGLSSPDEKIRKKNLDLFELGCITASEIGAIGILDNGPLPPYVFPEDIPITRHYDEDVLHTARLPKNIKWATYYEALGETYRAACKLASAHGLTFQLHPCLGVLTSTTDGFLRFADMVKADNLRFNFDTANLFAMKENLLISLHQVIDYVDYIHISDNHGHKVEHLPAGDGNIDWDEIFNFLHSCGYRGYYGVDVGGAETAIESLDEAYIRTATFISDFITQ
jgi:sugar phosphate isomerase/epimerase